MVDYFFTDSKWCDEVNTKGMVYDGEFLKAGAPRCDVLYGDRAKERLAFRRNNNIPYDAKIVMFAPTFREGAKDGKRTVYSEIWSIDFDRLLNNLEKMIWRRMLLMYQGSSPTCKLLRKIPR